MKYGVFVLCLIALCACQSVVAYPQGELRGCGATLRLDIVSTPSQRQKGLMGITSLPDNYAMLFVFPHDTQPVFWMHDTPLDLDVVFMRGDGTITQIDAMTANTATRHPAHVPIRYALETAQGWMATHGVSIGQRCQLVLPALTIE